ncbi:MAG TPA: class I SAM-dependent methyltransferase [Candidatus Saccharimonadales bacterium]|nr:class I SAM-dependent methyltransferase [Candidatus Saccharimonadales bacterium]
MSAKSHHLYDDKAFLYDLLYSYKDYGGEIKALLHHLEQHGVGTSFEAHIVDLACGTGEHVKYLAEALPEATIHGVDLNKGVIDHATAKQLGDKVSFSAEDMVGFFEHDNHRYDLVVCLFASLQYITETRQLKQLLANIYDRLKPDCAFVFDLRYAREHWLDGHIVASTHKEPDIEVAMFGMPFRNENMVTWNPALFWKTRDGKLDMTIDEHTIRLYSVDEIKSYLQEAGFKTEVTSGFGDKSYDGSIFPVFYAFKEKA